MTSTVLVTGIGGNVGQGVLRILRAQPESLRLVGTNTRRLSGGNHLCDVVHEVPWARSPEFAAQFARICSDETVDLVIPCTDDESVELKRLPALGNHIAGTAASTCATFHDKLETARAFARAGIPFAATSLPHLYDGSFDRLIVKPRSGHGSRGIILDPPDPKAYDTDQIVQRRHLGREVTTALYVTRSSSLHGMLCLERETSAEGATVRCRAAPEHERLLRPIVEAMVAGFAIRGCCNLQAIVTDEDEAWPFEVNCRVSGTASIRHALGFEDVGCLIDEYLFDRAPRPLPVVRGTALRLLMDIVYRDLEPEEVEDRATPSKLF